MNQTEKIIKKNKKTTKEYVLKEKSQRKIKDKREINGSKKEVQFRIIK
jgi:hypothetical protein